jgi:hypothetical protein
MHCHLPGDHFDAPYTLPCTLLRLGWKVTVSVCLEDGLSVGMVGMNWVDETAVADVSDKIESDEDVVTPPGGGIVKLVDAGLGPGLVVVVGDGPTNVVTVTTTVGIVGGEDETLLGEEVGLVLLAVELAVVIALVVVLVVELSELLVVLLVPPPG